eukprot:15310723-Heterocapsa_arctica.AAC.1
MVRGPWTCCGTSSSTAVGPPQLCARWAGRGLDATGLRPRLSSLPLGGATVHTLVELAACECRHQRRCACST